MRWNPEPSLLQQAARNGFIVAGLLLFAVGVGDMLAGRTKWHEYHELLAEAPPVAPRDPAALFPKSTEAQEHRVVAEAKLAFYELLFLVGQLLALGGSFWSASASPASAPAPYVPCPQARGSIDFRPACV